MATIPYGCFAHIEAYYRQRIARPIVGLSVNHDARQGARLRVGAQAIELHVSATGKLREPPRVKLDKIGPGRHLTQSERIRDKLKQIGRKLVRDPSSKVLLDLRDRYIKRLAEMN
jgi:hypothetical protein